MTEEPIEATVKASWTPESGTLAGAAMSLMAVIDASGAIRGIPTGERRLPRRSGMRAATWRRSGRGNDND